jgi:hypothetical protein
MILLPRTFLDYNWLQVYIWGGLDRRAVKGRMDERENDWNTLVIACGCGFWG